MSKKEFICFETNIINKNFFKIIILRFKVQQQFLKWDNIFTIVADKKTNSMYNLLIFR